MEIPAGDVRPGDRLDIGLVTATGRVQEHRVVIEVEADDFRTVTVHEPRPEDAA